MRFLRQLRDEIKAKYPDTLLIGEALFSRFPQKYLDAVDLPYKHSILLLEKWLGIDADILSTYLYVGILDGAFNFPLQRWLVNYIAKPTWCLWLNEAIVRTNVWLQSWLYPADYLMFSILDNHDMDRFLFRAKDDKQKLERAAQIIFNIDQPVAIYYGTEVR